jgi:hypothetical protein
VVLALVGLALKLHFDVVVHGGRTEEWIRHRASLFLCRAIDC